MDVESSPKRCIIEKVTFTPKGLKDSKKLPGHILDRLLTWIELIETDDLLETRKIRGFRDEALKGKRLGQRSIRLNKAYRAIYSIKDKIIVIEEVNKHDY